MQLLQTDGPHELPLFLPLTVLSYAMLDKKHPSAPYPRKVVPLLKRALKSLDLVEGVTLQTEVRAGAVGGVSVGTRPPAMSSDRVKIVELLARASTSLYRHRAALRYFKQLLQV